MFFRKFFSFLNDILTLNDEVGYVNTRRLIRFSLFILIFFALVFSFTFILLLRSFPELQLPNVVGQNITTAIKTLQKQKLKTYIASKYSTKHERFEVIEQRPSSGTSVKQSRTITLTVSLGPRISEIPNFIGEDIYKVKAKLFEVFSTYQTVPNIIEQRRYSTNLEKDRIIKQIPTPGTPIDLDEDILFVVSRGIASNEVIVLNYTWKNYKEVQAQLESFGIDVRVRGVVTVEPDKVGQIFSQNIRPGQKLNSGGVIEFKVGIKEGLDNKVLQSEVYRVYSIKVPHKRNVKKSDQKTTRLLKIVVKDELGMATRFERKVFVGLDLDIPYKTYGHGTLTVYLDGHYYNSFKF